MKSIHLGKKKIVELTINDVEYIAALDNYAIDHFQKHNKKGFLSALEDVKKDNISVLIQLLGSIIREKKNGRILGANIDHFQKHNKKGFLSALEDVKKDNISVLIQLLGSIIREKKNGRILGANYLKQFDTFDIISNLAPLLTEIFPDNLPEASNESEKK